MALNLGDLFYNITIQDRDIDAADAKINKLKNTADNSSKSIQASFIDMKTAVAGTTLAVGALVYKIADFAIQAGKPMEQAEARMKSMLGSTQAVDFSMNALREASYRTGNSIVDLADNFGKMSVFVQSGHINLQEATDLSLGLSDAMVALGGDTNNLGNVMYGLSQSMGAGVVRAEEFNQVMEPLPGLLNRIERENGMVSGSLRQMVNDGQVTSDQFKNLLIPALKSFQTEANNMSDTLSANQGKMSATFQAIGEDIYDYINDPLSEGIKLFDEFMQSFVSVKRASGEEIQKRLNDVISQQSKLANTPNLGRYESQRGTLSSDLDKKANELIAELQKRNAEAPDVKITKTTPTETPTVTGGGGGSASKDNGKAEAERALQERLQLQQQYAQLETDLIQGKFEQQEAIARQKYTERQALIGEFEASNIATQYELNQLSLQSEVELNNQLLEIERQRQAEKAQIEAEYRQFRAEGMATELEQQLAMEDLNYQNRLLKLREFLEQKVITEAEFKGLSASEEENHKTRQDKAIADDTKKKDKEIEKTYKANYLAKAAYATDSVETAKWLSSEEADAAIEGADKAMSAMASSSKEAFEIQKAVSIAKATIQGYEAAVKAYSMGDPLVTGPLMAAASLAFTGMQISAISSAQFQGGRKAGGHVSPNSMYRVNEDNKPELFSMGDETFLMTSGKGGRVTSNADMMSGGGGVMITIVNQVQGVEFVENRISDGEVEIIARRVVARDTPDLFSRELSNPNSKISRAMSSNYNAQRRRS